MRAARERKERKGGEIHCYGTVRVGTVASSDYDMIRSLELDRGCCCSGTAVYRYRCIRCYSDSKEAQEIDIRRR